MSVRPKDDDTVTQKLILALRQKHGVKAAARLDLFEKLSQEPWGEGWYQTRCGAVSKCVQVLFIASSDTMACIDESTGRLRVEELGANVEVEHLEGTHMEVVQAFAHGESARHGEWQSREAPAS